MSSYVNLCYWRFDGWFATGVSTVVFGGAIAPMILYGLLFVEIENTLNITAVQTGIIPSVTWALSFLGSPLCEYLKGYTSFRTLVIFGGTLVAASVLASSFMNSFLGLLIFYGILHGLGSNFVLHGVFCILYQHFPERNGALATGIALGGATGASLILTVMYEYLLPVGGWRVALQFTALFTAVLSVPGSCLLFSPRREYSTTTDKIPTESVQMSTDFKECNDGDTESQLQQNLGSWRGVLSHPVTWALFLAIFLPTLSWSVYWINLVSYLDSVHVEGRCMSNILTVLPITELIGKVGIGVLAEAIPRSYLLIGHNLFFLAVTAVYTVFPVYKVLFICTIMIGARRGSYNVLPFSVMDQLLPTTDTDKAITVTMVAVGTGFSLGTIPAGAIFDHAGSYTYAFALNMIFYLIGALLLMIGLIRRKNDASGKGRRRRSNINNEAVTKNIVSFAPLTEE